MFGTNCVFVISEYWSSNHFDHQWIGRQNKKLEIKCITEWFKKKIFMTKMRHRRDLSQDVRHFFDWILMSSLSLQSMCLIGARINAIAETWCQQQTNGSLGTGGHFGSTHVLTTMLVLLDEICFHNGGYIHLPQFAPSICQYCGPCRNAQACATPKLWVPPLAAAEAPWSIKLQAKLLEYFVRSHKSNIDQSDHCWLCCRCTSACHRSARRYLFSSWQESRFQGY